MSAVDAIPAFSTRRRASAALPQALALSLIVHAAAGTYLLGNWHRTTLEMPRQLTVLLEPVPIHVASPPTMAPSKVERSQAHRPHSYQAPVLLPGPRPTPAPVESVAPTPPSAIATPEPTSALTVIANAPPSPSDAAGRRPDPIELPHFNVAYLNNPKPAYPAIARKLGLEGVVVVRVQVSATGAPQHVALAKTSGVQSLDEAAIKAVQTWTFVPAKRGDQPVAHPIEVPIRFQLRN